MEHQRNDAAPDAFILMRGRYTKPVNGCLAVRIPDAANADRLPVEPHNVLHPVIGGHRLDHKMVGLLRRLGETLRADL